MSAHRVLHSAAVWGWPIRYLAHELGVQCILSPGLVPIQLSVLRGAHVHTYTHMYVAGYGVPLLCLSALRAAVRP